MTGELPGLEEARARRERIAALLPDLTVATGVMILTLADGTVLEIALPECRGSVHAAGHTAGAPAGWTGMAFWSRASTGTLDLTVRIIREPDADGEPMRFADVVAWLHRAHIEQGEALIEAIRRYMGDDDG